ncbi:MAG TPA: hypothetical protein PLL69_10295, partial [Gemmatimonadales bacterium]|nr:hypothetical protein [Gemmatimonadales bacterium]
GKGWEWLGVERLVLNQPVGSGQNHILWVGGDGSTRLYRNAATNVWVSPREAFPDTLKLASGEYTRYGRHGVRVVFDGSGHHVRTINRVGHITRFYWTSERIDSVRVPPAGSGGRSFRMRYDGSGKLDSVVVAAGKGINVTVSSGLLTGWNWPDGTSLTVAYDGSGRVSTTVDGRGGSSRWLYGDHGLLTESRIYYAVNDSSVTKFTPWQGAGFASGVGYHTAGDTANAVTTIYGPRVGVNDDAVFHVDKWGAVTEVKDALNNVTRFHRTDANVPALVTRVDYPVSRRVMMTWNTRGNLTKLTDSTWGAAAFPKLVTTWAYSSANAPDSPSSVTAPDGTVTSYTYTSLGLTDSIIDPRSHRTKFVYGTPGDSILGQVVQVIERAVPTWVESSGSESTLDLTTTLTYFSTGNIRTVTSPSGGRQRIGRDTDGRIVGDTNAVGLRTTYTWDSMDRQTRRIVGRGVGGTPSPNCLSNEFICADQVMDALNPTGSADTTLATYTQGLLAQLRDPRGVLRSWRYDLRGLMTAEVDEASAVDSARYDQAGLVTVHRTRYIASVTNSYDALDRLTKTVIPGRTLSDLGQNANVPADSVIRSYDVMGNVVSESNRNSTITRTWFATGHLRSERVVPVGNRALADSVWYAYDNGGRLRRVSWQTGDSVVYRYNSAGDLDTMRVHIWRSGGGGNLLERWRFEWDGLGRRRTIHYPANGMTVNYAYDRLGTLRRIQSSNPGSPASVNRFDFTFRQDSVDVLGRPLHQTMQCPYGFVAGDPAIPCRDWLPSETWNRYNRLGALAVQTR